MKQHQTFPRFGSYGLLLLALLGAGCATPVSKRLYSLQLGMSQAQANKILGEEYVFKASRTDANGAMLQMWESRDKKTEEAYSLYFKDGFLAQWGAPARMDFPELNLPKR